MILIFLYCVVDMYIFKNKRSRSQIKTSLEMVVKCNKLRMAHSLSSCPRRSWCRTRTTRTGETGKDPKKTTKKRRRRKVPSCHTKEILFSIISRLEKEAAEQSGQPREEEETDINPFQPISVS